MTPISMVCVLEKQVDVQAADGELSSRILIGAILLEHCDSNIDGSD